jgi:hypothetical protein
MPYGRTKSRERTTFLFASTSNAIDQARQDLQQKRRRFTAVLEEEIVDIDDIEDDVEEIDLTQGLRGTDEHSQRR